MNHDKNEKIETVYQTSDAAFAEVIRQLLENEGINAQVTGSHQAGLVGLDIMKVEVLVFESDVKAAKALIEQAEAR